MCFWNRLFMLREQPEHSSMWDTAAACNKEFAAGQWMAERHTQYNITSPFRSVRFRSVTCVAWQGRRALCRVLRGCCRWLWPAGLVKLLRTAIGIPLVGLWLSGRNAHLWRQWHQCKGYWNSLEGPVWWYSERLLGFHLESKSSQKWIWISLIFECGLNLNLQPTFSGLSLLVIRTTGTSGHRMGFPESLTEAGYQHNEAPLNLAGFKPKDVF